jgi:hypothetical protein
MGESIEKSGSKRVNTRNLTKRVHKICKELGCPEPAEFLAYVVGGVDPRNVSSLYRYLHTLKNKVGDKGISRKQWTKILELLEETPTSFEPIYLSESIQAANKLLEYLYAKQKAVEVTGSVGAIVGNVEKMDAKEIRQMKEIFDREF